MPPTDVYLLFTVEHKMLNNVLMFHRDKSYSALLPKAELELSL